MPRVNRRAIHATFAALALLCATGALLQGLEWRRGVGINRAMALADAASDAANAKKTSPSTIPQVELMRALALARTGDFDGATKAFNGLILTGRRDAIVLDALFDLGNLYLRQGLAHPDENSTAFLPMIELAKQRYRDLLRVDPEQWDARFNLERALRLAPETEAAFDNSENEPVDRRKMMAPDMAPPELP
jgi:mxaK protein